MNLRFELNLPTAANAIAVIEMHVSEPTFSHVLEAVIMSRGLLSRGQAAKLAAMSAWHFSRAFHKAFGVSFADARFSVRMNLAAQYLTRTQLRVAQISDQLGYSESKKFHAAFRRYFGTSPTSYRSARQPVSILRAA